MIEWWGRGGSVWVSGTTLVPALLLLFTCCTKKMRSVFGRKAIPPTDTPDPRSAPTDPTLPTLAASSDRSHPSLKETQRSDSAAPPERETVPKHAKPTSLKDAVLIPDSLMIPASGNGAGKGVSGRGVVSSGLTSIKVPSETNSMLTSTDRTVELEGELSDYDNRKGEGRGAEDEPEIPEESERSGDDATDEKRPLTFKRKGRIRYVPKDQLEPWGTDKSRLVVNPERRAHVIRTIGERGGWVIDHSALRASKKEPTYIYCPPLPIPTPALAK